GAGSRPVSGAAHGRGGAGRFDPRLAADSHAGGQRSPWPGKGVTMGVLLLTCLLALLARPVQATIRYVQLGATANTNCTTGQNIGTPLSGSTPLQTLQRGLACTA